MLRIRMPLEGGDWERSRGRGSMVRCLPGSGKEEGMDLKMRERFCVSGIVKRVVGRGCGGGCCWCG